MLTRPVAVLALLIGFLLLATSVVRFVTAREQHPADLPTSSHLDTLTIAVTALGMLLVATGLAIFVRRSRELLDEASRKAAEGQKPLEFQLEVKQDLLKLKRVGGTPDYSEVWKRVK